jgi:hypothetical protein
MTEYQFVSCAAAVIVTAFMLWKYGLGGLLRRAAVRLIAFADAQDAFRLAYRQRKAHWREPLGLPSKAIEKRDMAVPTAEPVEAL